MKKSMFEIIQSTPYCSNCGKFDWRKNKNGTLCCVYCGHPMVVEKDKEKEQNKK